MVRGWKGERLKDWEQRGLGKREVGGPMGMDTEWEDFCKARLYSRSKHLPQERQNDLAS